MRAVGVTGSNGFVGRHLCQLLERRGHAVRRIVRRDFTAKDVEGSWVSADTGDLGTWRSLLGGIDTLIHLIGRTHVGKIEATNLPLFKSVNVGITQVVAQAAQEAGVGHLIYVSSIKACGEGSSVAYTEETPPYPEDVYGQTKLEAEQFLRGLEGNLGVTVIRPPLIYGPGVGGNMERLMRAVHRGLPLPLGLARCPRSLLYVGNLIDALEVCTRKPPAQGAKRLYHVADAHPVSIAQLISIIASASGTSPRLLPVPLPVLRIAARAFGRADQVARLITPLLVDASKISHELGWSPTYSTSAGLAQTIAARSVGFTTSHSL